MILINDLHVFCQIFRGQFSQNPQILENLQTLKQHNNNTN